MARRRPGAATGAAVDTTTDPAQAGAVEQFRRDRIIGWVAVRADAAPTKVTLQLNGREIASSWANEPIERNSWGEVRPFRFWLKEVWDYTGPDDELTVRLGEQPLPINKRGMFVRPTETGPKRPADLMADLDRGYVFGQKGRLQLSKKLDTEWQRQVLSVFEQVRARLAEWHGYELFLTYGSLLGAVREGGFIGHDLDLDSSYISRHTDGASAVAEMRDIALALIEAGYAVGSYRTHLHVTDEHGTRIDVFHLYFDAAGKLCFPFGIAGTGQITAAEWRGTHEVPFSGGRAVVPVLGEQMAELIYGADWRQPKPGFGWWQDRTHRDPEGIMGEDMISEIYWADFYTRTEIAPPSPFSAALLARDDVPSTVIDIGCGAGRDSFAFAAAGRSVVGLDGSAIAVQRATERAVRDGLEVTFSTVDVGDAGAVRTFLDAAIGAADGPVLFYLRFLLHSIEAERQDTLLGVISACARPGDRFAAEFRTDQDEKRRKTYDNHYRRFQNGPAFGVALREQCGFDLLDEQEGTGFSPYQDEDPVLYRVIARRRP